MSKRIIAAVLCSALGLIGASRSAEADMIGRYECNFVGPTMQEPIGDREGHAIASWQYSCFGVDGLLKGAVLTGASVSEWNGPRGTYLAANTVHRAPGGLAVGQLVEGVGSVIVKDGKPVGSEASGRATIKFASGTLAALSGKTINWTTKSIGPGRFEFVYSDAD